MPTVIAFANQKGGVGKTTIATQLAYYLRLQKKKKVLFLDMDAQGSASETLNERNPIAGTTSQALFREELDGINVDKTPRGIDLIGSNQSPEAYDVESLPLAQVLNPKKWLAPILGNYDYVVIDCPPSLGRRLAASLILADFVVCPIKLSGYAVSGLKSLFSTIVQIQQGANSGLQILGIAVNEYQDNAVQRKALAAVNDAIPGQIFKKKIHPRSPIDVASAGTPITEVRNGKRACEEMTELFKEMLTRMTKLTK